MMRSPRPHSELYAWHTKALDDLRLGLRLEVPTDPQCGWYARRMRRGAPLIGIEIRLLQPIGEDGQLAGDEQLQAWIAGCYADPIEQWTYCGGRPIAFAEFQFMQARAAHAAEHDPNSAFADPRQPVDWLKCKLPSF